MQNLEHKVYALISTDASLQDILDTLILGIEERDPKVLGSVLSLEDGNTLRHLSSPRLSKAYREAIDSLKIGPAVGSCGTACYRRERVVVSDIVTDPLWAKFADFAASEGLRACWSQPIISSKNQVLGAFAMYYRHPHSPTDEDIRLIEHAARVASIAIERKQADVALHKSEERYRKLFEYAPDGILIIGPDKNYIDANISLCRMLGYSRNELMKLHAEDIVAKAEIQRVEPAFRDIKARLNHSQEWQLRRKDGSVFMADVIATQLPDRNILSMIHDITERKEAEATLEKSETRLRLSIAASNIGLWDWNLVTNDVYFSPEWKGQLGYTADEMPNRFEEWERRLHPDDLAPTLAKVRAFIENPAGGYTVEFRLRHKDGSYRWIFTQAQILSDAAGKPVRMMGCHIDITDRKNLEESLAHKNIALKETLSQLEIEKEALKNKTLSNIEHLLMPAVRKLKRKKVSVIEKKQLDILENNLKEITGTLGQNLSMRFAQLSPKEIEICSMIRGGLTTKDIAVTLNISSATVETHRNKIRKKLGISNQQVNLTSFIQSL